MDTAEEYTRFERARIIGVRALQLSRAPPMIKSDIKDPIKLAETEFEQGVIPLFVKKKLPPRAESA